MTHDEKRESIAWIIDPFAFKSWDMLYRYCLDTGETEQWAREAADSFHLSSMNEARTKADAILALTPPPATSGIGAPVKHVPGTLIEQLKRASKNIKDARNSGTTGYLAGWEHQAIDAAIRSLSATLATATPPVATSEIGAEYRRGLEDAARVADGYHDVVSCREGEIWIIGQIASAIRSLSAAPTPQAEEVLDPDGYLWKWVERGLFDQKTCTPKEALEVMAHHPSAPWNSGRWDVDHKPYATAFYAKFPRAAEPDISGYAEWADDAGKGDGA